MTREIKSYKVLEGVRGQPRADIDALAQALSDLSRFAAARKDHIESLDLNPFLVLPGRQRRPGPGCGAGNALGSAA